jgi:Streptomyces sporulation and cell division protein, SsgA.
VVGDEPKQQHHDLGRLGLKLVVPQQTIVPLVASLYYSGSDPYAVRMAFHVGTDEPVEWIFARDLLAAGIESRHGDGDVQVWPSRPRSRKPATWM